MKITDSEGMILPQMNKIRNFSLMLIFLTLSLIAYQEFMHPV